MKNKHTKIRLIFSLLLCVEILGLTGVTLAWIRHLQQLNTVALVQIPSKITLSGANRSELTKISLELTPDDEIKGDGEVTIRRVFCVESTADFRLEVVRTTNIQGMNIKIYPAKEATGSTEPDLVKGTDGVSTFYYKPDRDALGGSYLNLGTDGKTANNTLHAENYVEENSEAGIKGDTVQKNAEPLYWRTINNDSGDKKEVYNQQDYSTHGTAADGTDIYYRYYVLELSWDTTDQETDMVYLLASH